MARSKSIALLAAALLTAPPVIAADINEGLIAWYPFDKGAADKTGNIESLESESILPILKGKFGGAVKLDGDTFIAIPVDLGPDLIPSITISLWVKTDPRPTDAELEAQLPNQLYIVSESIAVGNLKNDSTYFYGEALNHSIVGPKHTARRGQWQHVALVRTIEDRPNAKGEIEPQVVAQFHSGGRVSELVMPFRGQGMATDLYLGTNSPRYPYRFRGALDDLRIYDRALSNEEVGLLAKMSPSRTAGGASERESAGLPDNAGTTDTSVLGNVNFGGLSASDIAIDNPTDDNRDSATPVTTFPAAGDSPSIVPPNENLDDFEDRMDDPEFQDSLKAVDWNVKGMIPLTQEEKANIYPGSTVTVKIRVDKDDPANKIPDVKLAIKGAQSSAESVPLQVMTSEQVPTARRDIPMTITVPADFVFAQEGEIGTYYADTWLLTANGMPLQDSVTKNNSRRLSFPVNRPAPKEDCGEATMSDDGFVTKGDCLIFGGSPEVPTSPPRFKIDPVGRVHTAISGTVFIDSMSSQTLGDSNGVLQKIQIGERANHPCYIAATGNIGGLIFDRCSGDVREKYHVETASNYGITAIKVCHREINNRVKGIETETRAIRDDGTLADELVTGPPRKLANCNDWREFVRCPSGMAAAGIQASFRVDGKRSSLHGLGLICGNIVVEDDGDLT